MFFKRSASEPLPTQGEYREATILFVDIEGFTAMTEQLPATEVVALLNEYFEAMTGIVYAHGGHVDVYIGDAMLAVWATGNPVRDAARAVYTALEMQKTLVGLQRKWMAEGRRPVKIRSGIASGPAVFGEIGSSQRRQSTVIGDVVNTAARLEALNKELHTDALLAGSTFGYVSKDVVVRDLGSIPIRGRQEPLEVYALVGWQGDPP